MVSGQLEVGRKSIYKKSNERKTCQMSKTILVSGLLNIETTVAVRGFPINYYPIDYPFFKVNSNVAGVGCNITKALTALGDDVKLFSFTGNDYESGRIFTELQSIGVSTGNIRRTLKNTPASVILFDPDGKRQVYCDLKDIQEQSLSPESMTQSLSEVDAAVLCNINFNRGVIKKARQMGVLTATDVHVLGNIEDGYNRDFMENADILFLSDEGLPCRPEDFLRQLHDRYHNRVIVLGMGSKGALLLDAAENRLTTVPAYDKAKVVNTVGAGDSLFSAFLHYYVKGLSPEDSLRRAVIFAGIKIGFNGAGLGFSDETTIDGLIGG